MKQVYVVSLDEEFEKARGPDKKPRKKRTRGNWYAPKSYEKKMKRKLTKEGFREWKKENG